MDRARSEYRLSLGAEPPEDGGRTVTDRIVSMREVDQVVPMRGPLAEVMLAAYRGTIDDEGETLDDAGDAIDHYLDSIHREHSFVAVDGDGARPVAFAFVVSVDELHYIDPVVVSPDRKRGGLGSTLVVRCLRSLRDVGIAEVGATITDGNVASERLFARLGFVRRGPWPPAGSRRSD